MIKPELYSLTVLIQRGFHTLTKHPRMARFGHIVSLCTLGLMAWIIWRDYPTIERIFQQANLSLLSLAFGLNLVSFGLVAWGWSRIFSQSGYLLSLKQLFRIYFLTGVVRYLPGGVWHFGGRLVWLGRAGVPFSVSMRAIITEQMLPLWIGLVSGIFLAFYENLPNWEHKMLLGVGCLILLTATGIVLRQIYNYQGMSIAGLILLYLTFWLCSSASVYILIIALGHPPELISFSKVVGFTTLSWVVGYVVVFVPGGLGLREATLAAMLSIFLPLPFSITVALLSRLIFILSELFWALSVAR